MKVLFFSIYLPECIYSKWPALCYGVALYSFITGQYAMSTGMLLYASYISARRIL